MTADHAVARRPPDPRPGVWPSLTVIVLTCNSAVTVGACLESLAEQEHAAFAVVVVDDDSADDTLEIVGRYAAALDLSVVRNGSRSIPRGRNLGLEHSHTDLAAFVDSDDVPARDWTRVIVARFRGEPDLALISGRLIPAHRTRTGQAIALNDDSVYRLFGAGMMMFTGGNCAVSRRVAGELRFDEDFRFAEDLALISRCRDRYAWAHEPAMVVSHYSRPNFRQYAAQMHRYGFMKQRVCFMNGSYRWLDFVPLAVLAAGAAAALAARCWPLALLIVPFSLLEAGFVVCYQRCPAGAALLSGPAWVVKNLSWSSGLVLGLVTLAFDADTRRLLRAKRAAPP